MHSVQVLENESVSMWYYPEAGIVHHQFHGHIWGDRFRKTLEAGAEVFETRRASKWLSDDRENCSLSNDDATWAMEQWFPRVHRCGWKYWAIVLPEHVIGQMNMKRFMAIYSERGVSARIFDSPSSALEWLKNPKTSPY